MQKQKKTGSPDPSQGPSDAVFHPGSIPGGPGAQKRPLEAENDENRNRRFFVFARRPGAAARAAPPPRGRPTSRVARASPPRRSSASSRRRRAARRASFSWQVVGSGREKKFYDFGFSSFSASRGRFWAPGPSKTNPG